jgi:ATP phosphoribosyltransferase
MDDARAPLVIAVPKGRILEPLASRLRAAGFDGDVLLATGRHLMRDDEKNGLRYLLLKPDDVPTYVEYGAAQLGVVGRDVLLEREYDLVVPVDLGIGICRMVVAALPNQQRPTSRPVRVATKYPGIAARHFAGHGRHAEVIFVQGSVELAPVTGLADCIVDLVESGETLRQNGLVELETVCPVSSVVVANRVGLKLERTRMAPLLSALRSPAAQSASDT